MTRPNASLVQREVARHYGAPAKTQRKRVWWGEEVRRRERDLPRLSGARRGILSPHRRVGGIVRLTAPVSGLPAWWGRCPLGVPFERAKGTKTRLGRSPPKDLPGVRGWNCVKSTVGPSPLLWPLLLPPHQATLGSWPYGWVVPMSGPTLEQWRSRRRETGTAPQVSAPNEKSVP